MFERFLSPERDGPPDIDIDIESGRREEVIAYVYERYGRHRAAQVANVITYRARSAIRDVGKALGHGPEEVDAWAKAVDRGEPLDRGGPLPPLVGQLWPATVLDFPRHLGLHSGGMVICDRPVIEVCPVEWARHPGRTVLQWDKDDCAAVGLVKFDLLGLGMLDALHRAVDLIRDAHGVDVDLAMVPQEDAVYDMLCRADTVGVFQVESRAQMATLPRIRPRCFSDLVIEVAIIRPGPIQGGSVHPYIRRRQGLEAPDPPHPLLERALEKTLGVPLFQEQLMQIAIDAAGFTPAEADELRQAMGAKRSGARMARLSRPALRRHGRARHHRRGGRRDRGQAGRLRQLRVPREPRRVLRLPRLLERVVEAPLPRRVLRRTAQRPAHGVLVPPVPGGRRPAPRRRRCDRPHVDVSGAGATLDWGLDRPRAVDAWALPVASPTSDWGSRRCAGSARPWRERIAESRPYASVEDLVRRAGMGRPQLEALATAGALEGLAPRDGAPGDARPDDADAVGGRGARAGHRRPAAGARDRGGGAPASRPRAARGGGGRHVGHRPHRGRRRAVELARPRLDALGVIPAGRLLGAETDGKVLVGGVVTHRQHPESAKGTVFLNLEDETGMVNVICSPGAWERWRDRRPGVTRPLGAGPSRAGGRRGQRGGGEDLPLDLGLGPGPAPVQASRDFR